MHVEAMAGVVRQKPGGGGSPDQSQKQKKGRGQQQQAPPAQGKGGGKRSDASQKDQHKDSTERESASSAGSLQQPSAWRLPQPKAPMGAPGEQSPAPDTRPTTRPRQKM